MSSRSASTVLSLRAAWAALAATSLLPGAVTSAEDTHYSLETARALPLSVLAEALLGRERASDVVEAGFETNGIANTGLFAVIFLHRPAPVGADFCLQVRTSIGRVPPCT